VAQIRQLMDKIFYSSKATMHIFSHTHTKFELSILITARHIRGSQKSFESWCCKSAT